MNKRIVLFVLMMVMLLCSCQNNKEKGDKTPDATLTPAVTETNTPAPTDTPKPRVNLALGKKVESDVHELDYIPENAVDGDYSTRWSGFAPTDLPYHYLMIDLGEVYALGKVCIDWEAIGHSYRISCAKKLDSDDDWEVVTTRLKPEDTYEEFTLGGIEARYVKLEFGTIGTNAFCSIYEIEIYEYDEDDENGDEKGRQNLALGKTATSEFVENGSEKFQAGMAVDGDLLTRWSPGNGKANDLFTWHLDLGEVYDIKEIVIYFESCNTEYTISVSEDNQNWTQVYEGEPLELEVSIKLNEKARYILFSRPGGDWGSIYEFMVYDRLED